jgi:hypothetical protein
MTEARTFGCQMPENSYPQDMDKGQYQNGGNDD